MTLRIVIVAVTLIALFLVFAATKPSTLSVRRSVVINAPPEKIFVLINDLHRWGEWNSEEDSTVTRTFSGAASGVGAASEWDSRGKAGKGRIMITESQASSRVAVQVDFVKPFHSHNRNEFTLEQAGGSTTVTWSWRGQNLYFMKVMGVFASMDKMMGKHFEAALVRMKAIAER